jgi:fibronectin-binding autotransporter adhesin
MRRFRSVRFHRLLGMGVLLGALVCISANSASGEDFDWRNMGGQNWLTSVKSQFGGTCWDFSACGTIEARYMLTRNDLSFQPDVSEQQIVWETSPDMGDMGGGWESAALDYFTSHGVVSEAECPTNPGTNAPGTGDPWPLATGWESRVWKTTSNQDGILSTTENLKNMLKTQGPIVTTVWAGNDLYDHVSDISANYRGVGADPWAIDHAIVLVGFHDDASLPTGGYWVIKNSWSDGYGESGYGYVPYGVLEAHQRNHMITGPAYYTGSMATATWNGGAGTWTNGGTNWNSGAYAWENKETSATFAGTGGAVTVSGSVIAHGMTINSTGYTFSGGSITVTSGGITANQNATINSPLYIGGPQTWAVASGKTLTVGGALHTIISDLTISGAGNVLISGAIDGGGVLNAYGAKPGGLIKSNTGSLTLTGASNYGGDIKVNSGTLSLNPSSSATYSGAFSGSGSLSVNSSGTVSIGGGASAFTGAISIAAGTLQFVPATGLTGTFSGVISGTSRPIIQNGAGTTKLTATNTYTGTTTIANGILQANSGTGLPAASVLILNGGVLQSNSTVTFSRTLGTSSGSNYFNWGANGGGFSAGGGAMTVRVNNGTSTLTWGTTIGSQIVGTLKLSSTTAAALTSFQNGINLNGAARVVQVDDNLNSTTDYAQISGVVSGTASASSFTKTGDGKLYMSGTNTYAGITTISGGALQAAIGTGIPINSFIKLDGGVYQNNNAYTFNRSLGASGATFQWTANGGGFAAGAGALTVNIGSGTALTWGTTVGSQLVGTLKLSSMTATNVTTFQNAINLGGATRTLNVDDNSASTADYAAMSGVISGNGSLVKTGLGKLRISGSAANTYTGSTTIMGGDLELYKTSGYAIPGDLYLAGGTDYSVSLIGTGQIPSTAKLIWNHTPGATGYQRFKTFGRSLTVAGISDNTGFAVIENAESESGYGAATLTVNNSTDCSYSGYLRDRSSGTSGTLALVKSGTGTLKLGAGNISYTGGTTISGGKLILSHVYNSTFMTKNITDNAALEFDLPLGNITYSGVISGSGSVGKTSGGALTLSGSSGNTYTGGTTVSDGTLILAKTAGYAIPGNFTIANSNTFVVVQNANQFPATAAVSFTGSGDPHFEVYGNSVTVGGISNTAGGVIENTEGESGPSNGTLVVSNSTDCTYSAYVRDNAGGSGSLALTKSGTGALTLAGGGIYYSGATTVSAGKLVLRDTSSFNSSITNNAALEVNAANTDFYLYGAITGSGSVTKTGACRTILAGNPSYIGATTISGGTLVLQDPSNAAYLAKNVVNNGNLEFFTSTVDVNYSGVVSGSGSLGKTGPYTLTISGLSANAHTGGTNVSEGNLVLAKTSGVAIPGALNLSAPNGSTFTTVQGEGQFAATSVINFNGGYWPHFELLGHSVTVAGISDLYGTGVIENTQWEEGVSSTGVFTVNNTTTCSFNGYLRDGNFGGSTGALAFVKGGSGTLSLIGGSTGGYTGGLTINAGTLDYSQGVLPNCTITINGGTLIYPGQSLRAAAASGPSVAGVSVYSAPRNPIVDLLTASYNAPDGPFTSGRFVCGTADALHGLGWDVDAVTSLLTVKFTSYGDTNLDGRVGLDDLTAFLADYNELGTWSQGDFNYDGIVNAEDLQLLLANYDSASGMVVRSDASLDAAASGMLSRAGVSLAPVPEPGTLALLAASLVSLLGYVWRKRK